MGLAKVNPTVIYFLGTKYCSDSPLLAPCAGIDTTLDRAMQTNEMDKI